MFAHYAIVACPERDLIRVTLSGFFDPGGLAGFDRARRAALARLRCGPNQHDTLVDVSELKLQAQGVFEAFRAMIAAPETRSRRLAFVTGHAAIRMQVRRLIDRDDIRCFADLAAAEAWLAAPAIAARSQADTERGDAARPLS